MSRIKSWEAYPEATLTDFTARCMRPGARNYVALEALENYQRELDSNRERDAYFKKLDEQTRVARAAMEKAHGGEE